MSKVSFVGEIIDTITRPCLCEGCPFCKSTEKMYCNVFTLLKCKKCKDFRCKDCFFNERVCNYCKRVI